MKNAFKIHRVGDIYHIFKHKNGKRVVFPHSEKDSFTLFRGKQV